MAPVAEGLILDPPEFIENRIAVDLQAEGLEIRTEGLDYGESSAQVEMVRKAIGEGVVDRRWPAVECTVPLVVREEGETSLAGANFPVEAKVGLYQQRGGWIRRDFADDAGHAGSVGCPVFTAGLTPVQGWMASHQLVAPDVLLKLSRWPIWYATVAVDGDEVNATAARDLKWEIAEMLGTAPGLIRIRVKNENSAAVVSRDFRGLISSIESEHFSDAPTADLVYEAEDLTPMGGAEVITSSGASSGKVVEHDSLTAGWLVVLGSEIDGVGHMTHTGVRRPRIRVKDPVGGLELRLDWRALGSTRWSSGPVVVAPTVNAYQNLDMGECRPETAILGEQCWEWRILARVASGTGKVRIDRVFPLAVEQIQVVTTPETKISSTAASTKTPGEAVDDASLGAKAWSNPGNAKISDSTAAQAALGVDETSHYLRATDFGFAIPEGATVTGIMFGVRRRGSVAGRVLDYAVRAVQGGEVGGADRSLLAFWGTAYEDTTYGDASDIWDLSWTPTLINDAEFGCAISVTATLAATALIDAVTATVFYSEARDENRVCFAERSAELRTDGIRRQHPDNDSWGTLILESGALPYAAPGGLEKRGARGIIIVSQGDLGVLADEEANAFSVRPIYQPGYLFARESAT